ncbi:cytochrome P450 315a1, mitochondrial isoform X1 [Eupeodes corollae]|uniref:cytochrome P450 315a1, mitochondrial isoform X1 n=1 Tax=Eupeodes corollae TaxID=290404 RepID=UPI00248F8CB5|nr:cytochrome P450 315a1, mitochondrial isoform X1 [Eupeodes corollae]
MISNSVSLSSYTFSTGFVRSSHDSIEIASIMSGKGNSNYRFKFHYLCALIDLAYSWLRTICFLFTKRLKQKLFVQDLRKEPRLRRGRSLFTEWKTILRSQTSNISSRPRGSAKRYEEIPMAKGWPLIGTTLELIAAGSAPNLHKYIDKRHQNFGHIFRERLGTQEAVFVSSANLMRSVFLYEGQYPAHPLPDSWVMYNKLHNCKRGLFFMDGPEWETNRKIMNRLLLNGNLNWLNSHIEYCTNNLINEWKSAAKSVEGYLKVDDLEGKLYKWAINVVCSVMFGYKDDDLNTKLKTTIDEFSKIVHKIFENSAHLMNFPPKLARVLRLKIWTQFEKDVTEVLKVGGEIIDMQMKQSCELGWDNGLFVKMRLAGMSIEDIKRIFVDLIVAAGDTTAFSSQWALYLLSQSNEIQTNIRRENFTNLSECPILQGLIKETLRLYPVAPFIGRYLKTDAIIGDYEVKKNVMVILSLYTSGRDAEHFPEPLDVQPDRWIRDPDTGHLRNVLQAHGTLPFAIGSRSCIGKKIALHQMYSLVSEVTRNFNVKCFNTKPIEVVLRLVAVPNAPIELGLKLLDKKH